MRLLSRESNPGNEQSMESTIHIEALHANLHGARILCYPHKKMPPIMDVVQKLRDPFKKRILITNTPLSLSKYIPLNYDVTFHAKDSADWTLILTYITYAPKPLFAVVEDMKIPEGLWQKLTRQTTVVHMTTAPILHIRPYDAIFFQPMEDITAPITDYSYKILQSVYRATYTPKEHKEILQELRVAGAGMGWTRMDQPEGEIFWYDPVAHQQEERLSTQHIGELLGYLSEVIKEL